MLNIRSVLLLNSRMMRLCSCNMAGCWLPAFCAGDLDEDSLDEPLLTSGERIPHPRPKNVFALERTYLTWTHMAVTVRDMTAGVHDRRWPNKTALAPSGSLSKKPLPQHGAAEEMLHRSRCLAAGRVRGCGDARLCRQRFFGVAIGARSQGT